MSYVPRHARTPVYKKVLRSASASVAVTAAFISTQPATAVEAASDAAATSTSAESVGTATATADVTDTESTASAESAESTASAESESAEFGDEPADDVADAAVTDAASVLDSFDFAKLFTSVLSPLIAAAGNDAQNAEVHEVVAGESIEIDTTKDVDPELMERYQVAGIEVDNADDLAARGIHVSVTDDFTLTVDTDEDATVGETDIDFHFVGDGVPDDMDSFHATVRVTAAESESTADQPDATNPGSESAAPKPGATPGSESESTAFQLAYPEIRVDQMKSATADPKTTVADSAADLPEGTRFSLVATANGKPLTSADGSATSYPWLSINSRTGVIEAAPEFDTTAGTYTAVVTATLPDSTQVVAPVTVTVNGVKDADKYTLSYSRGHLNPKATEDSEMNLMVEESRALPEGTTFALDKDEPYVSIDENGRITLHANAGATPNRYLAKVIVTYPDGSRDVVNARYDVSDVATQAESTTIVGKATDPSGALHMKRRTEAVLPALVAVAGQTIPKGTTFAPEAGVPDWAKIDKETGAITLTPSLNDHPGDYVLDTLVTYPDGSAERVTRYVHVDSGYSTGKWFQYKRKDGLGKKVGRALDKALGTELDKGEATQQPTGNQPDTNDSIGLIGTAVKPSGPTAGGPGSTGTTGGGSANAPSQAAATGTATTPNKRLATTGTDTELYLTAGAAASSFALAAAGAFALRRRR